MRRAKIILEKIPKFLLSWFALDIILMVIWISGPDNNNKVVVASALTVGLLSFLFYEENRLFTGWLTHQDRLRKIKFFGLGLAGAVIVETIFWFWEKALGASGVAASSNLLVDLAITLPVYFLVLLSFWFIQKYKNYSLGKVFVIGGVYELLVDGVLGGFVQWSILLGLTYGLIGLPIFMVIYSLILLPPAIFLKKVSSRD
ncbi:MAG: hypothetical protein NT041_02220 [Candidatus Vogelbacteria bacterium]|nr:hypothetical protein [Candidatus Vogelbacteria bacterium]